MKQLIASFLAAALLFTACGGPAGSPSGSNAPARY